MSTTTPSAIPHIPHSNTRGFYTRIAEITRFNDTANDKGYSRQHVSGVLRGTRSYSDTSLRAIARACNVEMGWLADYIEYVKVYGVP